MTTSASPPGLRCKTGSRSALLWSTRPRVRGTAGIRGGFRFLPLLGFAARRQAHAFLQHSQIVLDPLTNDSGGLRSRLPGKFNLPQTTGLLILNDPLSGCPIAIMD